MLTFFLRNCLRQKLRTKTVKKVPPARQTRQNAGGLISPPPHYIKISFYFNNISFCAFNTSDLTCEYVFIVQKYIPLDSPLKNPLSAVKTQPPCGAAPRLISLTSLKAGVYILNRTSGASYVMYSKICRSFTSGLNGLG